MYKSHFHKKHKANESFPQKKVYFWGKDALEDPTLARINQHYPRVSHI